MATAQTCHVDSLGELALIHARVAARLLSSAGPLERRRRLSNHGDRRVRHRCVAVYISRLSRELGVSDDTPMAVHCDNRSATDVAYNPEHYGASPRVGLRGGVVTSHVTSQPSHV